MIIKKRSGFTLVELSLSLVFIATLSLIIALLISNTVSSYQKGLILKQVNTLGMDIVDDMRSAIQGSSTKSLTSDCGSFYNNNASIVSCESRGGREFATMTKTGSVQISSGKAEKSNVPLYGAFCTGRYSYIWNSGYFFTTKVEGYPKITGASKASFKYGTGSGTTISDFRLLKIRDDNRAVCISANSMTGDIIDITSFGNAVSETPVDLLKSQELGLAIYNMTASTPVSSAAINSVFYTVSFILGTVQGGVDITASGNFCATPNDYKDENFDYCAINKFNFAARAIGD